MVVGLKQFHVDIISTRGESIAAACMYRVRSYQHVHACIAQVLVTVSDRYC